MTRKEKVLDRLKQARMGAVLVYGQRTPTPDGWVPGHLLCTPDCGGSEGLRRLRELRQDGHVIEMTKAPGERTERLYRLVPDHKETLF